MSPEMPDHLGAEIRQIRSSFIELHGADAYADASSLVLKNPMLGHRSPEKSRLDEWLIIFIIKKTYIY